MQKFLQEYGLIIVFVACFFVLIGASIIFGNPFKQEVNKVTDSFFSEEKFAIVMSETPDAPVEEDKENQLSGTWRFNDTITFNISSNTLTEKINCSTNGENCTAITIYSKEEAVSYMLLDEYGEDYYDVYYGPGWYPGDEGSYQIITFDSKQDVSPEFYQWFITNATKQ